MKRSISVFLYGISCMNYQECAELISQAFSLSSSTISRKFIRATLEKIQELQNRTLGGYHFVALFMDGKVLGYTELIMALGVTSAARRSR